VRKKLCAAFIIQTKTEKFDHRDLRSWNANIQRGDVNEKSSTDEQKEMIWSHQVCAVFSFSCPVTGSIQDIRILARGHDADPMRAAVHLWTCDGAR